jgi:type I restriction enzyme S subunit
MMEFQSERTYHRNESAVFLKTTERFGGLSNMAGGYSLFINGIRIPTSEALYQACRFPHRPELQKIIIGQKSPMTAKMKSKPYRKDSRPDWDNVRVEIMWWCLRVKLVQHWEKFGDLLLSTGNKPIVEESSRDQFWGAKPINPEELVGINILGQLLTALREQLKYSNIDKLKIVEPPALAQFLLVDKPIGVIEEKTYKHKPLVGSSSQLTMELFTSNRDPFVPGNDEMEIAQSSRLHTEATPSDPPFSEERILFQLTFDY